MNPLTINLIGGTCVTFNYDEHGIHLTIGNDRHAFKRPEHQIDDGNESDQQEFIDPVIAHIIDSVEDYDDTSTYIIFGAILMDLFNGETINWIPLGPAGFYYFKPDYFLIFKDKQECDTYINWDKYNYLDLDHTCDTDLEEPNVVFDEYVFSYAGSGYYHSQCPTSTFETFDIRDEFRYCFDKNKE